LVTTIRVDYKVLLAEMMTADLLGGVCCESLWLMIFGPREKFRASFVCVFFVSDAGIGSFFFDLFSWDDKTVVPA
jgi:predicted membrane protein